MLREGCFVLGRDNQSYEYSTTVQYMDISIVCRVEDCVPPVSWQGFAWSTTTGTLRNGDGIHEYDGYFSASVTESFPLAETSTSLRGGGL